MRKSKLKPKPKPKYPDSAGKATLGVCQLLGKTTPAGKLEYKYNCPGRR